MFEWLGGGAGHRVPIERQQVGWAAVWSENHDPSLFTVSTVWRVSIQQRAPQESGLWGL